MVLYTQHGEFTVESTIYSNDHVQVYNAYWFNERVSRKIVLKVMDNPILAAREALLINCKHPNIIRCFLVFRYGDKHIAVLERGHASLYMIVKRNGPMPPEMAKSYILDAARGLEYLHKNKMMHRDIKPGNILVFPGGIAKLIDFGLATTKGESRSKVGTSRYCAPELLRKDRYHDRIDIWSLGVVWHFLLSGRYPFDAEDREELYSKIQEGKIVRDELILDDEWHWIERMLSMDPETRPSATELIQALE